MKQFKTLASIILAVVVLSSCNSINKMSKNYGDVNYKVTPEVLEAHGGEVAVSITGNFPEKYFHKKATVEATPVLVYEGGETAFEPVVLQGEDVMDNNKKISYEGGSFSYSDMVAYNEDMKKSELVLRATATMKNKSVSFDEMKLADGVIATSTYVWEKPHPILMPDRFQRITQDSKMADIHYVINRANIRGSELRNEDIEALKDFLKKVEEAERIEFANSEVSAYASPDGPVDFNEDLSKKRGESAGRFFDRELNRANVEAAKKEGFVQTKTTTEDWEGFKELVEQSNMEDKDLILRVLSMYSDPEVREKEIKNLSAAFEVLADEILPQLRRSKITVNVNKIGYSDEEIVDLVKNNPAQLNLEETLYAATLFDGHEDKLNIYKMALDKEPKCLRAANNIGFIQMHMGQYEDAKASFEHAQTLNNHDVVKNNLGYAYLMTGDHAKAKELFTSVQKPGEETNAGLGIIAIVEGNYQDAVNYFGSKPSYNAALANLLNDDAAKAKGMLDQLEDDGAWVHYLKAIVGVHVENEDYMFNNLRSAVQKDPELKEMAKKDLEFGKYFENETFKSIVN
jgi:tetratricopeptide (TPR) repeat protein